MVKKTKSQPNHPVELLPSRKRTNDIIRGIEFVKIMNNINDKNVQLVNNLLKTFEPNLNEYLSDISAKIRESDTKIHCRDLNYILDTIIERIFNLKIFEGIRWQHDIEESTKRVLNIYFTNLKCYREIYDSKNTHIHIKKHMYDLCEDIKYIIDEKKRLQKNKYCNNIFPRVLKRWIDLRDVYYKNQRHEVFYFDHNCTIDYIMNNFSDKECNIGAKPRKAKVQTGNKLKGESKQGLVKASDTAPGPSLDTETALGPDKGPVTKVASDQEENEDDPNVTEETGFLMDIPLQLPPVEEPKLDTTYAAASLCGVSLIGAMIYKFKPFGFGSRAPGMRNVMGGYPFPHAANGDYDMGNFEYLQTGIPNHDYHLGYGPAADH